MHRQQDLEYPLRKVDQNKEKALMIIDLLKNSSLTTKQIAEQMNCSPNTVRRINNGISHHDNSITYPIR